MRETFKSQQVLISLGELSESVGAGAGAAKYRQQHRQGAHHIFSLMRSFGPIRGQYSGHVICLDQSEASVRKIRPIRGADTSQAGRSWPMIVRVTPGPREARNAPRRSEQS